MAKVKCPITSQVLFIKLSLLASLLGLALSLETNRKDVPYRIDDPRGIIKPSPFVTTRFEKHSRFVRDSETWISTSPPPSSTVTIFHWDFFSLHREDTTTTSVPPTTSTVAEDSGSNVTMAPINGTNMPGPTTTPTTPGPTTPTTPTTPSPSASKRTASQSSTTTLGPTHKIEEVTGDEHDYYNSTYIANGFDDWWVDLPEDHFFVSSLSDGYLLAMPVDMSFDFPYYGHNIRSVYITTGGFLYVGDYPHELLTITQYVAPLMANFDTSFTTESSIRYHDNGTAFTVEWRAIHLNHDTSAGTFTFQTTLLKDGRIIFVYKSIPVPLNQLDDGTTHPVKVGLADGYSILDFDLLLLTITEYHDINLDQEQVVDGAVYILYPLTTCNQFLTSTDCLNSCIAFTCYWCSSASLCSTSIDRNRQEWLESDCPNDNTKGTGCTGAAASTGLETGATISIVLIVLLVAFSLVGLLAFAYYHPNSRAGIFLINLRQCNFGRSDSSEDRYAVTMNEQKGGFDDSFAVIT